MIKINKQVAKNKITCFLERNQVVLFFHCNNSVSLNKNDRLLELNKVQVAAKQSLANSTPSKRVTRLSGSSSYEPALFAKQTLGAALLEPRTAFCSAKLSTCNPSKPLTFEKNAKYYSESYKQVFTNLNTLKSIMVKNRLAKKVFLNLYANNSVYSHNESLFLKRRDSLIASLFQGPILLLGCSDIKVLEKGIDVCAKYKELVLFGAFYDKAIINNSQVKRLVAYSNNNQGYENLLSSMRSPFLRPFSLIRGFLNMRCFFAQQERLIHLLKARKQQILVDSL